MRLFRPLAGVLACLTLLSAAHAAHAADAPTDPLRLVPAQADFFLEVKQPRRLLSGGPAADLIAAARALPPLQEAYDSTTARRLYQLLAYLEKELGAPWPELLDRLASGGAVVAGRLGQDAAPALLVVQGGDEALAKKFFALALTVLEQELARQESKEHVERRTYRDCEGASVGKDLHLAVAGSALLVSNKEEALKLALDLHYDGPEKSLARADKVVAAGKLLPPGPLARLWVNLDVAHQSPQGKDLFTSPRNDATVTVLIGGILDVVGRAPYVAAGLYEEKNGFLMTVRLPAGYEGASADLAVHAPPPAGPGALPPLRPKGVLFSTSFTLDLGKFWEERAKLFSAQNAKSFEEFDQRSAPFLVGARLSQLLTQAGARHRLVAANRAPVGYKTKPGQNVPASAFVTEMRKPDEFAKSIDAILRGAALLAGTQLKLKLVEETYAGHKVVGYRFPEDAKVPQDTDNLRFNFSPCFVRVGNQMAFCSTLEFAREIVDLLEKEAKEPPAKASRAATRTRLFSAGAAEALRAAEDQLVSQFVLSQAVTLPEAREQLKTILGLVRRLGTLDAETVYEAKQLRYDFRLSLGQ